MPRGSSGLRPGRETRQISTPPLRGWEEGAGLPILLGESSSRVLRGSWSSGVGRRGRGRHNMSVVTHLDVSRLAEKNDRRSSKKNKRQAEKKNLSPH